MHQFYMDGVLLPVTPSSLTIKVSNQNKVYTLINEGQINILKTPGLSKISFNELLPNQEYPFAQYESGYQSALLYLSKLESLKTDCRPFKFAVIRTDDTGEKLMGAQLMMVSLESYELNENAETYGTDVMAKIELLQYRAYSTKTISFSQSTVANTVKKATVTQQRDTSSAPKEKTYIVKTGDNLWDIARTQLGDGSKSIEIYNLNKVIIETVAKKYGRASSSKGWWIYPGTVLRLPS